MSEVITKEDLISKLQTGDQAYDYDIYDDIDIDEYMEKLRAFEEKAPWSAKMKSVPHLKLKIPEFDADRAIAEVNQHIDYMVPINQRNSEETSRYGRMDHHSWSSRALVNYTPHSERWFQKQSKESATLAFPEYQPEAYKKIGIVPRLYLEDMQYYKTDLYDKLKYITDFISEHIADETYRVFIWKMKAEGYLNWHNHAKLPWHSDVIVNDKAIVHIPLITDSKIKMLVNKDDEIYSQHYGKSECWVFNNILDHAVENTSTVDRIHVAFFVPWHDKKFVKLLEKSYNE